MKFYDKYISTRSKSRKRRTTDFDMTPFIIDDYEFNDGCASTFQCYNSQANHTQELLLSQFINIEKSTCDAGGIIHFNSMHDKIYAPQQFFHHAFRGKCFPQETMCVYVLSVEITNAHADVIGCGGCPRFQIVFEVAYFNITTVDEVSFCYRLKSPFWRSPTLKQGGLRNAFFYEVRDMLHQSIIPSPTTTYLKIIKNVGININDNEEYMKDIVSDFG